MGEPIDTATYIEYATTQQLITELKSRINLRFIIAYSDRGGSFSMDVSNNLTALEALEVLHNCSGCCIGKLVDESRQPPRTN